MDQGIINIFKHHYRKRIVKKVLTHMQETTPTIVKTITNCFKKAGFTKDELVQDSDNTDEEDNLPLSELIKLWASYRIAINMDGVTFEDYVNVDTDVNTMGLPTDEDILEKVVENLVSKETNSDENESGGESMDETTVNIPIFDHAYSALAVLRNFISSRENALNMAYSSLNTLEEFVNKE
ncbi:hypothetical protein ABEB36_012868 [Hypothenemus hampei]|uniref:Uncharacterized protein n=1 Tax=Hypothenemus hampei TaxID=57062 RepID=A0ABD1E616_HYPHA